MTLSVSSISHRTSTKSLICTPSFHYHVIIAEQEYCISHDLMSREEITEKMMAVYAFIQSCVDSVDLLGSLIRKKALRKKADDAHGCSMDWDMRTIF